MVRAATAGALACALAACGRAAAWAVVVAGVVAANAGAPIATSVAALSPRIFPKLVMCSFPWFSGQQPAVGSAQTFATARSRRCTSANPAAGWRNDYKLVIRPVRTGSAESLLEPDAHARDQAGRGGSGAIGARMIMSSPSMADMPGAGIGLDDGQLEPGDAYVERIHRRGVDPAQPHPLTARFSLSGNL